MTSAAAPFAIRGHWRRVPQPLPVLLAPRFGLPAVVGDEQPFVVESLEPEGMPALLALDGADRIPLDVLGEERTPAGGSTHVRRVVRPHRPVPPGAHDLCLSTIRAARTVWVRTSTRLRVAHLTDLHIGGKRTDRRRTLEVVAAINEARPDLIALIGDIVDNADRARQLDEAVETLQRLDAPLVVVPGNHDHGFGPRAFAGTVGRGWRRFARSFHAYSHFELDVEGWTFIGVDSGPSRLSAFIRTRGLGRAQLDALGAALDRAADGVVVLSHAPTRTRLIGRAAPLGGMVRGARRFEAELVRTVRRGRAVVHLCGHTHWCDTYDLDGVTVVNSASATRSPNPSWSLVELK
jgi:UDP-2,3-diacylglucosamine pyrophosphatase LpxH